MAALAVTAMPGFKGLECSREISPPSWWRGRSSPGCRSARTANASAADVVRNRSDQATATAALLLADLPKRRPGNRENEDGEFPKSVTKAGTLAGKASGRTGAERPAATEDQEPLTSRRKPARTQAGWNRRLSAAASAIPTATPWKDSLETGWSGSYSAANIPRRRCRPIVSTRRRALKLIGPYSAGEADDARSRPLLCRAAAAGGVAKRSTRTAPAIRGRCRPRACCTSIACCVPRWSRREMETDLREPGPRRQGADAGQEAAEGVHGGRSRPAARRRREPRKLHRALDLAHHRYPALASCSALATDAIDLDAGTITIKRVVLDIDNAPLLRDVTKSESSARTISIPPALVELLREQKARVLEAALKWGKGYRTRTACSCSAGRTARC